MIQRPSLPDRMPPIPPLPAAFFRFAAALDGVNSNEKDNRVKRTVAIAALALLLVPSATMAQERGGDAAIGALSGAVVLGPVGALAGAIVGYTAGPSIARSWGFRRSGTRQARKPAAQETRVSRADTQSAPRSQASAPTAAQVPPPSKTASTTAPPVQGLE